MADVSHLKTISDGLSTWVPVASAFTGGVMAVIGGVITQCVIARREQAIRDLETASARIYISAQLIVLLRRFLTECRGASTDPGKGEPMTGYTEYRASRISPQLLLEKIQGDWSVLPPELLLEIHELPRRLENIQTALESDWNNREVGETEFMDIYRNRYRGLTEKTVNTLRQLERLCGVKPTKIHNTGPEKTE